MPGARRRPVALLGLPCAAVALLVIAPGTAAGEAPPGTPFGTATPTEQFVQSFQQQVTRQLQDIVSQSRRQQEQRLQEFEARQQAQTREQLQLMRGLLEQSGGDRDAGTGGAPAIDPPRVNTRRPPPGAGPSGSSTNFPANSAAQHPAATSDPNVAPHGFVEGTLLNGVVAMAGGPERESIVALSGSYQSANGFLTQLDGCFALVQGRPELATGRIDFKLARLTCNFPDGSSRTWDTAGWLVDADGIRGIRAVIVENAGRKAVVASIGGAVAGVGQQLSQQQYQTRSGGLGSSSSFVGRSGQDAAGGAVTGAANALGMAVTDYYNLFTPSLQVGGGTPVTAVLANELRLPTSGRDLTQTHTPAVGPATTGLATPSAAEAPSVPTGFPSGASQ